MRFETKLGLITIALLGTTFSFLLYQKIQDRKATLANQIPKSADSNYVNVEKPEDTKTVETKSVNDSKEIKNQIVKNKTAIKNPKIEIAQKETPKSNFNWETQNSGQTSFAQNDIKKDNVETKWKSAPKEEKPVTNPFQKEPIKNPFSNSFAAQKPVKKQPKFEIKPLEKKPVKETPKASFDFVKKVPSSTPVSNDKKKADFDPFQQNMVNFNPVNQNKVSEKPKGIEQKAKNNIAIKTQPKVEVSIDPFNVPAQKEIKTENNKETKIVQKKIQQKQKFDFASSGHPNPFQAPVEKAKDVEIKIPQEFTKQTPVVMQTEIKKPAFPIDPFAPQQTKPAQKKPEVKIAQNNVNTPAKAKNSFDLFDSMPEQKQEIKKIEVKQSKVSKKEFFTPNFEPPRLNVVQDEKPLLPEPKKIANHQQRKQPAFPGINSHTAKPKFNDEPKQIANQKPIQVSPFAPLVDRKDPLEGLKELPPTRRLHIPKSKTTNAQLISLQRTVPPKVSVRVHVAQPGDSYWKISKRRYGSAMYFAALSEFNKDRIKDPNRLKPGMKVLIPSAESLESKYPQFFKNSKSVTKNSSIQLVASDNSAGFFVSSDGQPMYRVGHEDTLTSIAKSHLGRTSRWTEIYEINKSRIKNAHRVKVGTTLVLPRDASNISVLTSSPLYQ